MTAHELLSQITVPDVDDPFYDGQRALLAQLRHLAGPQVPGLFGADAGPFTLSPLSPLAMWLDAQDERYDGYGDCLVPTRKVRAAAGLPQRTTAT